MSLPEFVALAYIKLFLAIYGGGSGDGLFTGDARYEMLRTRLNHAVPRSYSQRAAPLRAIWSGLVDGLLLPMWPRDYDADYADWRYHMDRERIEQMEHDKALNEQTNKPKQNDNVDPSRKKPF